MKKTMIGSCIGACLMEPINHYWASLKTLNLAYEWPRNTEQWSIFLRETVKIPQFWSGLRKKYFHN